MSTLTRDITTEPLDDGSLLKYWTVGTTDGRMVSLSALRTARLGETPDPMRHLTAPADSGDEMWVFNVIHTHHPVAEPGPVFGCPRHERCESDAIASRLARPTWSRIVAAKVADEAIWPELEALHAQLWPAGGAAA